MKNKFDVSSKKLNVWKRRFRWKNEINSFLIKMQTKEILSFLNYYLLSLNVREDNSRNRIMKPMTGAMCQCHRNPVPSIITVLRYSAP